MELQSRPGRIQLKVKGRGLHGILLVTGELGEAVGEGVGNAEVHIRSRLGPQRRSDLLHDDTATVNSSLSRAMTLSSRGLILRYCK